MSRCSTSPVPAIDVVAAWSIDSLRRAISQSFIAGSLRTGIVSAQIGRRFVTECDSVAQMFSRREIAGAR